MSDQTSFGLKTDDALVELAHLDRTGRDPESATSQEMTILKRIVFYEVHGYPQEAERLALRITTHWETYPNALRY